MHHYLLERGCLVPSVLSPASELAPEATAEPAHKEPPPPPAQPPPSPPPPPSSPPPPAPQPPSRPPPPTSDNSAKVPANDGNKQSQSQQPPEDTNNKSDDTTQPVAAPIPPSGPGNLFKAPAPQSPSPDESKANVPAGNAPNGNVPSANAPNAVVPAVNAQSGNTPDTNAPNGNPPSGNAPAGNAPNANAPNAPSVNTPNGNAPSANIPNANPVNANVPVANSPSGNTVPTRPQLVAGTNTFTPVAADGGPQNAPAPASAGNKGVAAPPLNSGPDQGTSNTGQPAPQNPGTANSPTNAVPNQLGLPPIVVGGKTYVPIQQASPPGQPPSQPPSSLNNPNPVLPGSGSPASKPALPNADNIVVGGITYSALAPTTNPSSDTPSTNKDNDNNNNRVFNIAGARITQGGPPATISGTTYSLGSDVAIIGTQTIPLSAALQDGSLARITPFPAGGAGTAQTVDGVAFTPLADSKVVVSGQTLNIGGPPITAEGGKIVSLASAGLVVGSSTVPIASLSLATGVPRMVDGVTITPVANSQVVVASQTLSVGGPAITQDGKVVSLADGGLIVGSSTIPLSSLPTGSPQIVDGVTITPAGNDQVVVGSQTLSVGGPAITAEGGKVVSLASGGLVVGSSTFPISSLPTGSPQVIDGVTITPLASDKVMVSSQTLSIGGPAITQDGKVVSLASGGLVVGSSTFAISSMTTGGMPTGVSATQTGTLPADTGTSPGTAGPVATQGSQSGAASILLQGTWACWKTVLIGLGLALLVHFV